MNHVLNRSNRCLAYSCLVWMLSSAIVLAQGGVGGVGGGGVGGAGAGGAGGNTTTTTTTVNGVSGIIVDGDGVLRTKVFGDKSGKLSRTRIEARRAQLDPDVAAVSKCRKVSLTALEAVIRERLDAGQKLDDVMRNLAGLTRIQYVFLYPESNELFIAGPAEGWGPDLSGRVIGIESGRPTLQLEDLIVALRAHAPNTNSAPVISCSIDPTKEGLANYQSFFNKVAPQLAANHGLARAVARGIRDSLGLQVVTVHGVSPRTHFARVLVEADYRMKLIGIGLERTPVAIAAYSDLATAGSTHAMQRWFFVPNYECVRVSDDGLSMELVGDGVKLVGQDEVVRADGSRTKSNVQDKAGKKFVDGFTSKYSELAAAVPIYAELRNLIDMTVVAAFVQKNDFYNRIQWNMKTFGDETALPVETEMAPQRVETAVNVIAKRNRVSFPMGGGVRIEPKNALMAENLLKDADGKIEAAKLESKARANNQWWWD